MTQHPLSGSAIAITGGARGIGRATAEVLSRAGARVAIGDLDLELAEQTAVAIGRGTRAFSLDVRERASFASFVEHAERELGPIYALVNNAGIMPTGPFLDEADRMTDTQIDVNLRGVIHGCKVALPGLVARRRGHIVNVASMAGRLAVPGLAVYCATKFAVVGLTEALAAEHRDSGVHFTLADAILAGLTNPRPEITVPGYLASVAPLQAAAPHAILRSVRRAIDDRRILHALDHGARADYDARLARVAALDTTGGAS